MTDAEVISTEVLEILSQQEQGLTAQAIYDESRIAISLAEVTGALNRLRNTGKVIRGTDKRWRTMNQAERTHAQRAERVKVAAQAVAAERSKPAKAEKPAKAKPRPLEAIAQEVEEMADEVFGSARSDISPAEALDAVSRVAKRDLERRQEQHKKDLDLEWLLGELEQEADAAQVRLDRYVNQIGDELLVHLVEMTLTANRALEAARSRA